MTFSVSIPRHTELSPTVENLLSSGAEHDLVGGRAGGRCARPDLGGERSSENAVLSIASLVLLSLVGCPKEEKEKGGGGGIVAQEGGITPETELPDDKDTRKFADHLVRTPVRNFKPSDASGGADIEWSKVSFGPKNHWEADAVLSAGGERVNCTEAGRWTAEKCDSSTVCTINLDTKKSSCPGRSESTQYRLQKIGRAHV